MKTNVVFVSPNDWNSIKRFEDLIAPYRVSSVQKDGQEADETTKDFSWMVSDEEMETFRAKVFQRMVFRYTAYFLCKPCIIFLKMFLPCLCSPSDKYAWMKLFKITQEMLHWSLCKCYSYRMWCRPAQKENFDRPV